MLLLIYCGITKEPFQYNDDGRGRRPSAFLQNNNNKNHIIAQNQCPGAKSEVMVVVIATATILHVSKSFAAHGAHLFYCGSKTKKRKKKLQYNKNRIEIACEAHTRKTKR